MSQFPRRWGDRNEPGSDQGHPLGHCRAGGDRRAGGYTARPAGRQEIASSGGRERDRGPFLLTGSGRQALSPASNWRGSLRLVLRLYPLPRRLPDTLARLAKASRNVGTGDDAFAIVLVSVDPSATPPPRWRAMTTLFGTPVIALTGSTPAIEGIKKLFGVIRKRYRRPAAIIMSTIPPHLPHGRRGKFAATISPNEAIRRRWPSSSVWSASRRVCRLGWQILGLQNARHSR